MKHPIRRRWWTAWLSAVTWQLCSQTVLEPYRGTFDPDGTAPKPWNLLQGAVGAAQGETVVIQGSRPIYGPVKLDKRVRLTRAPGLPPVKIGEKPVAETTFRAISYNCRIGDPVPGKDGLASAARAQAIRNHNWGPWDAFGFCELWGITHYNNQIRFMGFGNAGTITGFDYGGTVQHSGLVLFSKHDFTLPRFEVYKDCADLIEDCNAQKGFLRGRITKNGIGIWVYMTHTQADASNVQWSTIYDARRGQLNQIYADIRLIREGSSFLNFPGFPNDVFIVMGDFNVFGENREPTGSPNVDEYLVMNNIFSGFSRCMDSARQLYPQSGVHTFSHVNDLVKSYYYPKLDEANSARLDYILAINSLDGKTVVETVNYEVLYPRLRQTDSGYTFSDLSDHYPVAAEFRIIRTSN